MQTGYLMILRNYVYFCVCDNGIVVIVFNDILSFRDALQKKNHIFETLASFSLFVPQIYTFLFM